MRKITARIVHFFIESKVIDETDQEIYEYGLEILSENVKWGYKRCFARGEVYFDGKMFGYKKEKMAQSKSYRIKLRQYG